MQEVKFGDVSVTRIIEYVGDSGTTPEQITPDMPQALWNENRSWLVPEYLNPITNNTVAALQTWLVRSEGKVILIDTGAGNGKERDFMPQIGHLDTPFLQTLARAGVRPEDVDTVVNTHLHLDHVGWNTSLEGGNWVPTFPNATYLMPKVDFDFWNPANGYRSFAMGEANRSAFQDSVAPVHQYGQTQLWDGETHVIDANLRLELAPGHTPGASVVKLHSGGDRAVFAGDTIHVPLQILEPECCSAFCEDPAASRATRRRLLGWAADNNALVLPSHLGGAGGAEVTRRADKFAIKTWASFGL